MAHTPTPEELSRDAWIRGEARQALEADPTNATAQRLVREGIERFGRTFGYNTALHPLMYLQTTLDTHPHASRHDIIAGAFRKR